MSSILVVVLALLASAHAQESSLHALGRAYQTQYSEIKKLGPNATDEQKQTVSRKAFAQANELLTRDMARQQTDLKKVLIEKTNKIREDIRQKRLAKSGSPAKNQQPSKATPEAKPTSQPSARQGNTTGTYGGTAGAKNVQFGSGNESTDELKVEDGIIQHR